MGNNLEQSKQGDLEQQVGNSSISYQQDSKQMDKAVLNKKTTSIVAYFTIIGLIIAFLLGDRKGAKFHLNQCLVWHVLNLIGTLVNNMYLRGIYNIIDTNSTQVSAMNSIVIYYIFGIYLVICWIIGFIGAVKQEEKAMPLIGKIKIL